MTLFLRNSLWDYDINTPPNNEIAASSSIAAFQSIVGNVLNALIQQTPTEGLPCDKIFARNYIAKGISLFILSQMVSFNIV